MIDVNVVIRLFLDLYIKIGERWPLSYFFVCAVSCVSLLSY